ncbi:MAG: hypothetical protein FJ293_14115, partial [Planctomycetes bacterium]|nr:hypothetical protein [Planctomycetota bacterium]
MPTLPFLVCLIAPRGELAVANERLRRDLVLDPQRGIVSTRLVAADGAVALTGEEFRIRLADGRELTPAALPHCTLHPLPADRGARGALARYRSADGPHVVEVAWIAPTDVPWLLKQVRLAASGESDRVEWLAIEQFTLTDGSFTGGGCGAPARADNGLLLLPDHPGLECAVDGGRLAIRDHVAAAVTPTAWSATVTLALDRHATVLPERIASYAAERAAEGAHAAIRRIDAAWSLTDADLAPAADGPRTLPAEALRGAAAAIAAALRTAADDPARIVLLTPSSWLAGDRWFTSTLAPGAFGRALQELRSAPTAVALTVPFADAAGAPFALDSDEQLRAARKALVALLSADGRVAAPRWFVDLLPSTAAIDPRRAAQRVDGWIALLATQRKLAPEARLALVGATPLAPSWRRFGDHLTTGADEQSLLAAWPTAADRSAR